MFVGETKRSSSHFVVSLRAFAFFAIIARVTLASVTRICLRSGFVYTASTASRRATSRPGVPPRLDATYREDPWALTFSLAASASRASSLLIAALCSWALKTTLSCSKKQKKMAELMPLEKARGPTPVKKVLTRATPGGESRHTPATAPAKDP